MSSSGLKVMCHWVAFVSTVEGLVRTLPMESSADAEHLSFRPSRRHQVPKRCPVSFKISSKMGMNAIATQPLSFSEPSTPA